MRPARRAAVPGPPCHSGALHAQRMHGDRGFGAELVRGRVRFRPTQAAARPTFRSVMARPPRRARPAGGDGLVVPPYFLGEKARSMIPARGARSPASAFPRRGPYLARIAEAGATGSPIISRFFHTIGLSPCASRLRRRLASRIWMQIVADIIEHPGSPAGGASRFLPRRRLDGGDRHWPRLRLVGDLRLRAQSRPDRTPGRGRRKPNAQGYRRYREISRRLADRSPQPPHERFSRGRLGPRRHADRQRGELHQRALIERERRSRGGPLRPARRGLPRRSHARRLDRAQAALSERGRASGVARRDRALLCRPRALGSKPTPGALEAVRALAALGVAQACVSNSGRAVVDANLDALRNPADGGVLDQPRRRIRGQTRSRAVSRSRAPLRASPQRRWSRSRTAAPGPDGARRRPLCGWLRARAQRPSSAAIDRSRSCRKS